MPTGKKVTTREVGFGGVEHTYTHLCTMSMNARKEQANGLETQPV